MSDSIRWHTLANGMTLVAESMPSMESAAFSFLVPAGCCYDPSKRLGLAALTCEMLLRGAGSRDSRALVNDLEVLGVERGESVGVSQVSLGGATIGENLFDALAVYADILQHPHIPTDQLEAGRLVCLQELLGVEDEPSQKLMIELRRRRYADPWGRPSQGDRDGLEAATLDDVRQLYEAVYRPNGAILAVSGNVPWDALKDQVESLFGEWQPRDVETVQESPSPSPRHHVSYDSGQSHIGIAFPTVPYRHSDYFQAWAAIGVLSSGMSSRLFTEVRERRGLCYTIHASVNTQRDRASVLCYAGTTADRAQETLDVTCRELRRLYDGIEASELGRLTARIKSSLIMQQESTSARSSALARDWYHLGRARTLEEIGQIIDDLTSDSINDYLTKNPPDDFTVVTLGPEPLEVPVEVS